MTLLNEFLRQSTALQRAWQPFLVAIGIVAIVVWRILKHHYEGRLATKDELIRLREGQVQDYKDKLSGATPDEARARMDALENRLRLVEPRRLTVAQRERITEAMKPFEGGWIHIDADKSVPDATSLQQAMLHAFSDANWNISQSSPIVVDLYDDPSSGMIVGLTDPASPKPAEVALIRELSAIGITFDIRKATEHGIRILITARHM